MNVHMVAAVGGHLYCLTTLVVPSPAGRLRTETVDIIEGTSELCLGTWPVMGNLSIVYLPFTLPSPSLPHIPLPDFIFIFSCCYLSVNSSRCSFLLLQTEEVINYPMTSHKHDNKDHSNLEVEEIRCT